MKQFVLAIALGLFAAGCLEEGAESQPVVAGLGPSYDPARPEDYDKPICNYERDTGSNIPTKVCKTPRQRDADHQAGEDMSRRLNQGRSQNNGGGTR